MRVINSAECTRDLDGLVMLQVLLNKFTFHMKMTITMVSRVIMAELDLWLLIKRETLAFASV